MANFHNNGTIINGLPGAAMRHAMECKGLLVEVGSIYYGTGETETVEITDANGNTVEYEVPVTAALNPPTSAGTYTLRCVVSSNGTVRLSWS